MRAAGEAEGCADLVRGLPLLLARLSLPLWGRKPRWLCHPGSESLGKVPQSGSAAWAGAGTTNPASPLEQLQASLALAWLLVALLPRGKQPESRLCEGSPGVHGIFWGWFQMLAGDCAFHPSGGSAVEGDFWQPLLAPTHTQRLLLSPPAAVILLVIYCGSCSTRRRKRR